MEDRNSNQTSQRAANGCASNGILAGQQDDDATFEYMGMRMMIPNFLMKQLHMLLLVQTAATERRKSHTFSFFDTLSDRPRIGNVFFVGYLQGRPTGRCGYTVSLTQFPNLGLQFEALAEHADHVLVYNETSL
jgi:hypothetical protein